MRKALFTRGRLRNKFCKNPSEKNETNYKNQRNFCAFLKRETVKQYFCNMTNKGIAEFWKTIKAFLTSKGWLKNRDIMPMNNEEMVVTDDKKLARSFNEHYANIFERSSGLKPEKIELDDPINTDKKI